MVGSALSLREDIFEGGVVLKGDRFGGGGGESSDLVFLGGGDPAAEDDEWVLVACFLFPVVPMFKCSRCEVMKGGDQEATIVKSG